MILFIPKERGGTITRDEVLPIPFKISKLRRSVPVLFLGQHKITDTVRNNDLDALLQINIRLGQNQRSQYEKEL